MKKILIISSELSYRNGWGRVALEISNSLESNEIKIINVCGNTENKVPVPNLVSIKYWNYKKLFLTFIDFVNVIFKLRNKIDYIIATDEASLLLAHWLSGYYKVPFSFISHGTYALKILDELNPIVHKQAVQKAENIFTVSAYTSKQIKKLTNIYNKKIKVINNGVSKKFLERAKSIEPKKHQILTVGAIKERKGLLELISMLSKIDVDQRPILNVVGSYDRKDSYVRKVFKEIREQNLSNFVKFHNQITDDEMISIMDKSKVFILPSKNTSKRDFEGFGIVFLEASSRYLPVIGSYDCGNEDAIIHGKTGFLVKQGDVDGLKKSMLSLLNDSNLSKKIGDNGRLFAENMSWDRTTKLILDNINFK